MGLEVGRLVGDGAVGGGVALVEAIFGKQNHLVKQGIGDTAGHTPLAGAINKQMAMLLHLRHLLFTHGATQQVGFAKGIAG